MNPLKKSAATIAPPRGIDAAAESFAFKINLLDLIPST
jgi:hypothetical protein